MIIILSQQRSASFVFFFLPMLFVALSNSVLYLLTVTSINYVSSVAVTTRQTQYTRDLLKSDYCC